MSNIRTLREQLGLKQEDIAEVLGVSLANYNKKENGTVKVSLIEAKKLSDFFGKNIEEIFFDGKVSEKETKSE